MAQPPGFEDPQNPSLVCKLHKSLYGLKQAPRAWNDKFTSFLPQLGFHNTYSDSSLFVKTVDANIVILLLYVDDIIITGNDPTEIQQVIRDLTSEFDIKDLGPLHFFLGIQISKTANESNGLPFHCCQKNFEVFESYPNCKTQVSLSATSSLLPQLQCTHQLRLQEVFWAIIVDRLSQFPQSPLLPALKALQLLPSRTLIVSTTLTLTFTSKLPSAFASEYSHGCFARGFWKKNKREKKRAMVGCFAKGFWKKKEGERERERDFWDFVWFMG
ncbi:uncharacterized protein LOC126599081 [Malus sylvestris]|uniref:uncharacterized protein LOC126599081 n=1 Tax=Malus sylvestris TaxID=3752 RepID=UPI0021ACECE2|nr:uncharacterized protein LOC126599081 [Malus sylvestris]